MRNDFESKNGFTADGIPLDDDKAWSLLGAYADGEATPEEVARVDALLRSDPAYARHLALIRRAGESARALHEVEPPPKLRQAILDATSHRPTFARRAAAAAWWQRLIAVCASTPARMALAGGAVAAAGLAALLFMPARHPGVNGTQRSRDLHDSVSSDSSSTLKPSQPTPSEPHQSRVAVNIPDVHRGITSSRSSSGSASGLPTGDTHGTAVLGLLHRKPAVRAFALLNHALHHATADSRQYVHNDHAQRPSVTSHPPVEPDYSVAPMMDQRYQRQSATASLASSHETGVLGKDVVAADTPADAAVTNGMPPTESPAIPKLDSSLESHAGVRIAHVSQLPPSTFSVPTTELRRQMQARNLNFNTATMEGLQRREATLALISTHF